MSLPNVKLCLFVLLVCLGLSGVSRAAIVTYDNKSAFLTDTGATSATGALPNSGDVGISTTLGTVSLSLLSPSSRLFVGGSGVSGIPGNDGDWTAVNPGNDIAFSNTENFLAVFSAPVFSAGFDMVEPDQDSECNNPCVDSTFQLTLLDGASTVDSFNFNVTDNILAFIGVWSDTAFDRLELREIVGDTENEYFGEIYTGTTELSPVPIPAAAWLFGTALVGFVGLSRRRKL